MNKLEVLFDRLREEGWYCGWAELCCQSCAWACLPYEHEVGKFKGESVDFSKCLFNHEQDCCVDEDDFEGSEDEFEDMLESYDGDGTMPTFSPDQISESAFCFDGSKEGVKNLKEIIPIIEECGCEIRWNGEGGIRPSISWSQYDNRKR